MKLPKIMQDENPLKSSYFQSIVAKSIKKYKTDKLTFDWQSAQLDLIQLMPEDKNILETLIQFQNVCKKLDVPHFYSFFFVNRLLYELHNEYQAEGTDGGQQEYQYQTTQNKTQKSLPISAQTFTQKVTKQIDNLTTKKSLWNKIMNLIELRENLVAKINEGVYKNHLQIIHASIDDIRYINAQIIHSISSWKKKNKTDSQIQPFFLYEGKNYFVKMINDNAMVIDILNSKAMKFLSPPNPFYLSRDGNKSSMPHSQQVSIDNCMQILAKQKASELKMLLNPPKYASTSKFQSNESNLYKSQIQLQKAERIRNIYKSSTNLGITMSGLRKNPTFSNEKQKITHFQSERAINRKTQQSFSRTKMNFKSLDKPIYEVSQNQYSSRIQKLKKSVQTIQKPNKNTYNVKLQALNSEGERVQKTKAQNLMKLATYTNKNPMTITFSQKHKIDRPEFKITKYQEPKEEKDSPTKMRYLSAKEQSQNSPIRQRNSKQKVSPVKISSPSKNKSQTNLKLDKSQSSQYLQSAAFEQKSQASERIRARQQKNQSILSIYGRKLTSPRLQKQQTNSKPKIRFVQQRIRQKDMIDEELKLVKKRLMELNSKSPNIYKLKQQIESKKKFRTSSNKQASLIEKQQKIKEQNKRKQQEIQKQENERQKLLSNLNEKDKKIQELLALLKKQQVKSDAQINDEALILQNEKNRKIKQLQELRKHLKAENKLIKQQMQEQERKFIKLKEAEFQMREQEISEKYQSQMEQMKEEYSKRNKELEKKIIEEEKVRKQHEIKLMQEKREMEELRMQIEERTLREKLLQEILKEQALRKQQQQQQQQENQQEKAERLKRQILQREKLERKMLENYEEDNRKLKEMFEQMKRKNEQMEMQNRRKVMQIKKIQQQAKIEVQNLKKLQKQLKQASVMLEKEIKRPSTRQKKLQQQQQQLEEQQAIESIQELKLRVKQQILLAIMEKKRQQEEQQKKQQEERARKLAEMQEQIRKELRRQEEELERIEQQERERYERIKKQLEDEHRRKMEQLDVKQMPPINYDEILKSKPGQNQKIQGQEAKQVEKNEEKSQKQENKKENELKTKQSELRSSVLKHSLPLNQKEPQKEDYKVQQWKNETEQKQPQKQLPTKNNQQKSMEKAQIKIMNQPKTNTQDENKIQKTVQNINEKEDKQDYQSASKIEKQITTQDNHQSNQTLKSPLKQNKEQSFNIQLKTQQSVRQEIKIGLDSPEKLGKKQNQSVKQSNQQMLTKYQNLQQYLSKCKQIYIDDKGVPQFLTTFFSQFPMEVRQMLPFNQGEIERFMVSNQKKVDIFESQAGHSIGWFELDKYILMGQINCIQNIAKKYGQTQIEMTYIFNKSNPYQKQFLSRQVKIFDKVGFIFQKKLKEENMYSIKLIIKIPMEILPKNFKPPTNELQIRQKILIQMIQSSEQKISNKKYAYLYLLTQTLKQCLSNEQLQQLKEENTEDSKILQQKIGQKLYNDTIFKSIELDDKRMEIQIKLDLKYIQTHDLPCFIVKGGQFYNQSATISQKIYIAQLTKTLSMAILPYDINSSEFSLDTLLNIKTKKLQKQRDILICIPVWKRNANLKLSKPGPKKFLLSQTVEANLSYGSIISTNALKQDYKFIEAPFILALFETNTNGQLLRPLCGEVVQQKDLLNQKR